MCVYIRMYSCLIALHLRQVAQVVSAMCLEIITDPIVNNNR